MSFRTDFLPTYDAIQALAGPDGLDVRPNAIFQVTRTWSTGNVGLGDATDVKTEITPRPRTKEQQNGRELVCEPVSQLIANSVINSVPAAGTERFFEVVGPNAGFYDLAEFNDARPFRSRLVLRRNDERRHPIPIG